MCTPVQGSGASTENNTNFGQSASGIAGKYSELVIIPIVSGTEWNYLGVLSMSLTARDAYLANFRSFDREFHFELRAFLSDSMRPDHVSFDRFFFFVPRFFPFPGFVVRSGRFPLNPMKTITL